MHVYYIVRAQFGGCFSSAGCTGSISAVSSEDCCVNNPSGLYFTNGGQCLQCIVFGWTVAEVTKPESSAANEIFTSYSKGPQGVQIFLTPFDTGTGQATERFDYRKFEGGVQFLTLGWTQQLTITFRTDNLALEPDETIVLGLTTTAIIVTSGLQESDFDTSQPNVFFRDRLVVFIRDATELAFRVTDTDRYEPESAGEIDFFVKIANEQDLAQEISLLLTPMIAPEDFARLPDTESPIARANTHPDRTDFITDPITLTFRPGDLLLPVAVPIIDDDINEALEYFIVELSFADPASVPDTVSIERNLVRCDIEDNDDIFIGFELASTIYPEPEWSTSFNIINIIKGGVSEQTIFFDVNFISGVPSGSGFDQATISTSSADNDFQFNYPLVTFYPDENRTTVTVTIFPDGQPENTEVAQLVIEAPPRDKPLIDGRPPRFEIPDEFPTFLVFIEDDDQYVIGFETISYTVNEGIGSQEVCVRMFEPTDYLDFDFDDFAITTEIIVGVDTVADTADENDYTARSGFSSVVLFNNEQRRQCFNVMITDDLVYENEERFFLKLVERLAFPFPDSLVLTPNISEIIIQDNEGSEAPGRVLGLCTVVVWTTPLRSYGRITGYELRFVTPGMEDVTVVKDSRELFHLTGQELQRSNTMVQVRARTVDNGEWSDLVSLGCS